jgi:hypothetical protein
MEPLFFIVRERAMVDWGDYGRILQHGMGLMLPRQDGLIVLLRTGPFIPPITFPGWPSFDNHGSGVVVVGSVRTALEASGLSGLTFQPVLKGRIVWLPWHEWDLKAERPHFRPPGGEPENYILEDTHSTEASDALGDLWEVVPKRVDWIERQVEHKADERTVRFRILTDRCDNTDFFCIKPSATLVCSERAKAWIENHWSDWVSFVPLDMA